MTEVALETKASSLLDRIHRESYGGEGPRTSVLSRSCQNEAAGSAAHLDFPKSTVG